MKFAVKRYRQWLNELKNNIHVSRLQTALKVNTDMLLMYWYIGKQLAEKIDNEGWGARVIAQVSADLQKEFPEIKGFSARNLLYMKQFAVEYPELLITQQPVALIKKKGKNQIAQQPVAQFGKISYFLSNPLLAGIPWGHHVYLIDKITDRDERYWYINKTIENNWSRAVLQYQVETDLYKRQHKTKKASNFHLTLPKPQADLANQVLKDPYIFAAMQLGENITERELEMELVKHLQEFVMELGAGFAFVGRQYKLPAGRKDYYIDLIFYHLTLRCYVVIELKMDEFVMEHAGKMNGYLNIVNKHLRQPHDNPSIGIILCGAKDNVEVDYALTNINHPIGVSEYSFSKSLPKNLKDKLPSVKQLQTEVNSFLKKIHTVKKKK
ncbi:PDDEXK nuclease domain-containing protein [Ferruginibacter sp.]